MAKFLNEEMVVKIMELRLDLETMDFLVSVDMDQLGALANKCSEQMFKLAPYNRTNVRYKKW